MNRKKYGRFFILYAIFLIATFNSFGCKDEVTSVTIPDDAIVISIKNSDTYERAIVSGDEEGASIKAQARHCDISEIKRNSKTNYAAVYTYKPKPNYIGSDYVEIEIQTGSDGASPSTKIEALKICFLISR